MSTMETVALQYQMIRCLNGLKDYSIDYSRSKILRFQFVAGGHFV